MIDTNITKVRVNRNKKEGKIDKYIRNALEYVLKKFIKHGDLYLIFKFNCLFTVFLSYNLYSKSKNE